MAGKQQVVIAHRGASGYLPEHTLAAKVLAHEMGADFIEQDVVLTRDSEAIVLHDIYLDTVTNVVDVFPSRARTDGRYYAIDFSLAEIRQLRVNERVNLETGQAVYPERFPVGDSVFYIPTLAEEIELIHGLNKSRNRNVGLYPEIKSPAWHRGEGKDISQVVLGVLNRHGYQGSGDNIFLQCFDADENRRLREEFETRLKLVQLIGDNQWNETTTDFDQLRTAQGLAKVAEYAQAIGPGLNHLVNGTDHAGKPIASTLVKSAHELGLKVHPYTMRVEEVPTFVDNFDDLLHYLFDEAQVDGIFTDFPDRAVSILRERH
jgi:glycerophosphoryl diester phosphodiesterase